MRVVFTFFAIVLFLPFAQSQDLIVTTSGDSINCVISKVKNENIYFTFKHKDEIRNTLLPLEKVSYHATNFFQTSLVPKGKVIGYRDYQRFTFSVGGGFGYQTAKVGDDVPSDFRGYIKKLKSGFVFGADLTYYFSEMMGVGVKYAQFNSSNNMDDIYIEDSQGGRRYGPMSDQLSISFIGPTFSTRFLNGSKNRAFTLGMCLGYMGYNDDKVIVDNYKMTGSTLGTSYDIGYQFSLSEKTSLGIQLSLISGNLYRYKWDDGTTVETIKLESGEYEGLSRIDLKLVLLFGK